MSIRRNWVELLAAALAVTACTRAGPTTVVTSSPTSTGSAACFAPAHDPNAPPARSDAMFAFDVDTHNMVLFGGHVPNASGKAFDDTWTWDGTWTQQHPAQSPPPSYDGAMAYDSTHDQMVLYEPAEAQGAVPQTWTWDGTTWTEQTPIQTPPSRLEPAMADDPALPGVVLVGGTASIDRRDVWGWNGYDWTPESLGPIFGTADSVLVSPKDGSLIAVGNVGAYQFSNGDWTSLNVPWPSGANYVGIVAYMVGGFGQPGFVRFDSLGFTSSWLPGRDADWKRLTPSCSPAAGWVNGERPQMAYDESRDVIVLFSGVSRNDTWTFDGENWSPAASAAPAGTPSPSSGPMACFAASFNADAPSARADATFAFDAARHEMVLFGGKGSQGDLNDTWTWDGTWTRKTPAVSPPATAHAAMAYDYLHQDMVLFEPASDPDSSPETWTWDGSSWAQQQPTDVPPTRLDAAMAADSARGGVYLVGGTDTSDRSDIWWWDGSDWLEVLSDQGPIFGAAHSIIFSPNDHSILVAGNVGAYRFGGAGWSPGMGWIPLGVGWPAGTVNVGNVAYAVGSAGSAGPVGFVRFSDRGVTYSWLPSRDVGWKQLAPSCSPPARWVNGERPQMALDDSRHVVVLFGGISRNDTWTFDGENWSPGA